MGSMGNFKNFAGAAVLLSQAITSLCAQEAPAFEVASIKPSVSTNSGTHRYPGGRFTATGSRFRL
jgi:hypothetical protein